MYEEEGKVLWVEDSNDTRLYYLHRHKGMLVVGNSGFIPSKHPQQDAEWAAKHALENLKPEELEEDLQDNLYRLSVILYHRHALGELPPELEAEVKGILALESL